MKVVIEEFNNNWKDEYIRYEKIIRDIVINKSNILINVYHIGSTSIGNGLKSKPVIDMLLCVSDINELDKLNQEFEKVGFECMGEFGIKNRRYFRKTIMKESQSIRVCQIHSFQFDISLYDIERHLAFRDYLIFHPELCTQYSELKQCLINNSRDNIEDYCDGKDNWIKSTEKKALIWYLKNKK